MTFKKELFLSISIFILGACSATPTTKSIKLSSSWTRSTLSQENYGFRRAERTAPLVDMDFIYQGNGIDGVTCYNISSGQEKWKFKIKNGVESGLTIEGNLLYFGASDGQFYAVNKNNGKLIWSFPTRAENLGPAEVAQGVVYFTAGNNILYALDAKTGKQIWNYNRGDASSVSIRGAGKPVLYQRTLYVGFSDGFLTAINANEGTLLWERKLSTNLKFVDVDTTPLVDEKNIWISSYDGALYCLSRIDGQIQWRFEEGSAFPITLDGDKIYYASLDHSVYALNKNNGSVIWKYNFDEKYGIPTAIGLHRGVAIFGQSDGSVVALSATSGKKLTEFLTGNGVIATPAIEPKSSSIFIFSNQANLYKLNLEWLNYETENLKWQ